MTKSDRNDLARASATNRLRMRSTNKRGPLIAIPGVVARPPRHLGCNMFCDTILQGNFSRRRQVNSEVD